MQGAIKLFPDWVKFSDCIGEDRAKVRATEYDLFAGNVSKTTAIPSAKRLSRRSA
jgi:hypothetical protein